MGPKIKWEVGDWRQKIVGGGRFGQKLEFWEVGDEIKWEVGDGHQNPIMCSKMLEIVHIYTIWSLKIAKFPGGEPPDPPPYFTSPE